jgi:hypothetical protein
MIYVREPSLLSYFIFQRCCLRLLCCLLIVSYSVEAANERPSPVISLGEGGRLVYHDDERGNKIPDFSYCGYMGQAEQIPDVPVRVVVRPIEGDNTRRIQSAIDYVSSMPADSNGIRGAVLLLRGRYEIWDSLNISTSGVVLRGQGMGSDGTVLVATGQGRRTLVNVRGRNDRTNPTGKSYEITDSYVPVGSSVFHLNTTEGLVVGQQVNIIRPSTKEWIDTLGMADFGGGLGSWRGWKPGTRDLLWDRIIESIDGDTITVDAPITTSIEAGFGGALVQPYSWPGRISHVGVEKLRCESTFDRDNPKDEAHSWMAVTMENVQNTWVRQVTMKHFAGSAVAIWESCKWVTVQNCVSLAPVSEIGGYRRHTFFTMGQMTLFLHCRTERGRRDFATGHCAAGPNAFVQCEASAPLAGSGPIESWASGTLYDNVNIDGGVLELCNWGSKGQGIGWAAANSVLWQCNASQIRCDNPPTALNWAFGCWGELSGYGIWRSSNDFIEPKSLFAAQLADRLGQPACERLHLMPMSTSGYTSPSVEVAHQMTVASREPAQTLSEYIECAESRDPILSEPGQIIRLEQVMAGHQSSLNRRRANDAIRKRLSITNGWLTCNGALMTGGSLGVAWWRGNIRPSEAASFGPAVTRFVPGRMGPGFTDDLNALTDTMAVEGDVVLDHNHGLWYDRRRDDHERVRRIDGDVLPPFYELPFSRSGQCTAWDGLSKYDLTKYNAWYWDRLKEFADLCDRKGLVLFHENYFQHNILEAGAHWADFPWRSANNINNTDFPEPPPYAGNKRIFMDELFYDVSHPVRRPLHRAYVRKCLDNFAGNSNVVQLISAEYTGPLEFVQFWLDTISEWEQETGQTQFIALSCTKDVQDAVLADLARRQAVSIIDIRYWWCQSDGTLYAPNGGKHLSPRQHARLFNPKPTSFGQVYRAVREYRKKYPDKPVVYSADDSYGWAVLMGGGSLPNINCLKNQSLLAAIPRMKPYDAPAQANGRYALAEPGWSYLVYAQSGGTIKLELGDIKGTFDVRWIDPSNGSISSDGNIVAAGRSVELRPKFKPCVLWLTKQRNVEVEQ